MTLLRFPTLRVAALAAAVLVPTLPASAQTGDQLLTRLRTSYARMTSMRAEFTQTMESAYGGRETFSGTLLSQGQSYRVEAGPQLFVTDGRTTWMHDRRRNQVVVNRFVANQTAFSPTSFFSTYAQRYRVSQATPSGRAPNRTFTLTLTPKSRSEMFDQVVVTMRERGDTVSRIEMRDANGATIRYELRNVQVNPRIPAGTFTFATPRGAEVVDLRS